MNRPDNLMAYDELDLKLGIKSSLPHVKGTLALSVLLWECADHPSELVFSEQKDKETVLTQELRQWLTGITWEVFCTEINSIIVGNNVRMSSSEDKRLGAYFVRLMDLQKDQKMGDLSSGEYDSLRKKESAGIISKEGYLR